MFILDQNLGKLVQGFMSYDRTSKKTDRQTDGQKEIIGPAEMRGLTIGCLLFIAQELDLL